MRPPGLADDAVAGLKTRLESHDDGFVHLTVDERDIIIKFIEHNDPEQVRARFNLANNMGWKDDAEAREFGVKWIKAGFLEFNLFLFVTQIAVMSIMFDLEWDQTFLNRNAIRIGTAIYPIGKPVDHDTFKRLCLGFLVAFNNICINLPDGYAAMNGDTPIASNSHEFIAQTDPPTNSDVKMIFKWILNHDDFSDHLFREELFRHELQRWRKHHPELFQGCKPLHNATPTLPLSGSDSDLYSSLIGI